MSERSAAIGLASASSGWPPPNNSACALAMNDQVTASTRLRAPSARLALRVRSWIGVSTGLRGASPRSNGVEGTRSTPKIRITSSTMSALFCTSGRHDGTVTFRRSPSPATAKPRRSSTRRTSGNGTATPARRFDFGQRKIDDALGDFRAAGDGDLRRRAAAEIEHHLRRQLQPGQHEGRIDAALEAVAGIGIDAELAAGLGNVDRIPQRRLDEHVGGRGRAAGFFAAHDPGQRFHAVRVGDDADCLVERVGLAVERQQRLAGARAAHRKIAAHFRGIEHMQRPAAVIGDEVGDIDQRIDRAQPDRGEPLLQPGRRRHVLDAAHQAQPEGGTKLGRLDPHLHRAREFAADRLDGPVLERPHVGGGEIAGDAVDAGAVGAVRRQVDLDHRIVEPRPLRVVRADRRVVGQFDDAFVIVGDLQLELRDQHAATFDAADGADLQRHGLARDERPRRHEHALHAGTRIRRAADDLNRLAVAGVDHADAQPVGVGMLLRLDHARDDERRQQLAFVLDALDLEPDHGEFFRDRAERMIGVEMLLEPAKGEFHHGITSSIPPPRSAGRAGGSRNG